MIRIWRVWYWNPFGHCWLVYDHTTYQPSIPYMRDALRATGYPCTAVERTAK